MVPKVWFITGSSAGLGRAVTEHVLAQGDIAVATCRKPADLSDLTSKYDKTRLIVLKVDVSQPEDVKNAFVEVEHHFGRLDIVYSNAGYATVGEIEGMDDEASRNQFEVNYWGAVTVANESVRFFREVNKPIGGRIMVVGSAVGVTNIPAVGHYGATKFAVDGIHDAYSKEVDPSWNIKFIILITGGFKTRGHKSESLVICSAHPAYKKSHMADSRQFISSGAGLSGDPANAAKVSYKVANDPNAPLRVPLGMDAVAALKARFEEATREVAYGSNYAADYE